MHLVETYALSCGLKIDRPYVYEHYTSVPLKRFISFNQKHYPYFQEVITLIKPELDKLGIDLLQLRANQENVETPVAIFDNLSFGQWAYVMKHSLLHFGEDDYLFDLAAHFDVPRVIMFSHTYPSTSKPYWGSSEKERILFSTGSFPKPTLSGDPNATFIRCIKPEEVAKAIMELLGVEWKAPYETIYAGKQYRPKHDIIELVPDSSQPVVLKGAVANLGIRMDYRHDVKFMANVLEKTKASVVTSNPIDIGILQTFRGNITEICYMVDSTSDVQFVKDLGRLNLTCAALSYKHNLAVKERFFETCPVSPIAVSDISAIPELKHGLKGYSYKSAKRVIHGNKEYKDKHQLFTGQASLPDELSPCPEVPTPEFLSDLEFLFIVKPLGLTVS